jgi:muramidase (phage lysozyme)
MGGSSSNTASKGATSSKSAGGTTSTNSAGRYGGEGRSSLGGATSSSTAGRMGGSSSNTASKGATSSKSAGGTTSANSAGRYGGEGRSSLGSGSSGSTAGRYGATPDNTARRTATDVDSIRGGGTTTANIGRYGGPTAQASTPAMSAGSGGYGGPSTATGYSPDLSSRTRMGSVTFGGPKAATTTGLDQNAISDRIASAFGTPADTPTYNDANFNARTPTGMPSYNDANFNARTPAVTSSAEPTGFSAAIAAGMSAEPYSAAARSAENARRADLAQQARASENTSMDAYNAAAATSTENARRADLAQQARATEEQSMATEGAWQGALSAIRGPEAGKNAYNKVSGGAVADLENMSLSDVQAYQKGMLARGLPSTAVGAYQTVASTLDRAIKNLGLDPNTTKFSKTTQDMIARDLISQRAALATKKDGTLDPTDFANQLSKEWAAFKNSSGVGSYDNVGINKATVDFDTVHTIASNLLNSNAVPGPASGISYAETGKTITRPTGPVTTTAAEEPTTPQPAPSQPTTPATNVSLPQRAPKPTSRDAPPYQRSLTGWGVATGIDVLANVVPGSVVAQIGSMLLTGNTVGGNFADAMGGKFGENYASPERNTPMRGLGSGGDRFASDQPTSTVPKALQSPAATMETPASTFEDKYLGGSGGFNDTGRPTPEQKWDWTSPKYIGVTNAPSV